MKISKSILRRIKNIVLSVGFVSTFAFGHLIACNSSHVDNTPVITVPIQQPNFLMTPDEIDYNDGEYSCFYSYYFSDTVDSYTYSRSLNIETSYTGGLLRFYIAFDRTDILTGDYIRGQSHTFDLGNLENTTDIVVNCYYFSSVIMFNGVATSSLLNYRVEVSYKNQTQYYVFDDIYQYSEVGPLPFLTTYDLKGEVISKSFIDFVYNGSFNNGVDYVLNHLDEFNLYTYEQYLAYGQSEYYRGFNASEYTLSFSAFIREIFRSPITMFQNAFNFNLPLGNGEVINVGGILTFFLTIGIALTIVQLILKVGGH